MIMIDSVIFWLLIGVTLFEIYKMPWVNMMANPVEAKNTNRSATIPGAGSIKFRYIDIEHPINKAPTNNGCLKFLKFLMIITNNTIIASKPIHDSIVK